jgi:hypothetical protein
MIPVTPPPEPAAFDERCRRPGTDWLTANPRAKRPKDLWTPFKEDLAAGSGHLCVYAAMFDPIGTVDHYLSWDGHPALAYEWTNYRFANELMNKVKARADDSVLDPYAVRAGWFEILLPSLQMRVTNAVPAPLRRKAEFTLERLRLRDDERIIRWRRAWYELYERGQLTLDGLRSRAPLIAAAVERQQARAVG